MKSETALTGDNKLTKDTDVIAPPLPVTAGSRRLPAAYSQKRIFSRCLTGMMVMMMGVDVNVLFREAERSCYRCPRWNLVSSVGVGISPPLLTRFFSQHKHQEHDGKACTVVTDLAAQDTHRSVGLIRPCLSHVYVASALLWYHGNIGAGLMLVKINDIMLCFRWLTHVSMLISKTCHNDNISS